MLLLSSLHDVVINDNNALVNNKYPKDPAFSTKPLKLIFVNLLLNVAYCFVKSCYIDFWPTDQSTPHSLEGLRFQRYQQW